MMDYELPQKSSTTSYISACRMVNTCKENNVRIMEGFMFRFHPQHQKVLDLLNRNAIGKVFSFHGCYGLPPIPMTYKTQQGPRRRRVKRCCMLSYLCKQNCFPSRTNQCKLSS